MVEVANSVASLPYKDLETEVVEKIIAIEKVKETTQLIEQCLQQDKKVIVFTNFTEPLMTLHEK